MEKSYREYLEINFNIKVPAGKSAGGQGKEEVLVIFKESMFASPLSSQIFNYKPAVVQKSTEFAYSTMHQLLDTNKHLNFPRISSLQHFYDLCPSWFSHQAYFENE
jgi:hypothetical protein